MLSPLDDAVRSCLPLSALLPTAQDHWTLVIGLGVHGLVFFGSHYWHHGGFVVERRRQAQQP